MPFAANCTAPAKHSSPSSRSPPEFMNPKSPKLQQQQKEQTTEQSACDLHAREFATPEEMLRLHAGQTSPPPRLTERVKESNAKEPVPARTWWQRWFSRRSANP